ncbi:MAG: hypothetical protein QW641_00735 [Candidatus Aenigmatarchaeota archaeon]
MKKYKVTAVLSSSLEESLARVTGALERVPNSDILILSGKDISEKMAEYAKKIGI